MLCFLCQKVLVISVPGGGVVIETHTKKNLILVKKSMWEQRIKDYWHCNNDNICLFLLLLLKYLETILSQTGKEQKKFKLIFVLTGYA